MKQDHRIIQICWMLFTVCTVDSWKMQQVPKFFSYINISKKRIYF